MRFALVTFSAVALATLAGCGGTPPISEQGGFYVQTIDNNPTMCMIDGNTAEVGSVDPSSSGQPTVVTDGTNMAKVSCNVSGTSSFDVHGVIDDTAGMTGDYFEILIGSLGAGATMGTPATGSIIFSASWTANEPYAGPCDFWFDSGTPEKVDNTDGVGKVWVTFSCAALTSGMSTCPLKTGYALFQECLTSPAM